jgi:hypothetical protein
MTAELEPGKARIRHPDAGESIVPASAVPHHERSDWEFVEGDREDWPTEAQPFGGQPLVRIRHPVAGESRVPQSAVPQWRSVGWQIVEPDDQAAQTVTPVGEGGELAMEEFTVPQLRQLARDRGISPIPSTKPELLAALSGDQESPEDQAGDQPAPPSEEER